MPVTLLGTGFSVATGVRVSNSITNVLVPFTVTGDGRIDFVMPAGVDGTWADITVETGADSTTVAQAFWYQAPLSTEFNGQTGTVITLTGGLVITVPPQGVSSMFVITLTPQSPQDDVPGNLLLHVFRMDAMLNWQPVQVLTNPFTITLPVPDGVVPAGQRPWLYQWTAERPTDDGRRTITDGGRSSSVVGRWILVPDQTYDDAANQVVVALRPTGLYALSALQRRAHWFPIVSMLK